MKSSVCFIFIRNIYLVSTVHQVSTGLKYTAAKQQSASAPFRIRLALPLRQSRLVVHVLVLTCHY